MYLVSLHKINGNYMKNKLLLLLCLVCSIGVWGQKTEKPFKAYIYNNVYDIYMQLNLYDNNIKVPGHDLYGELPGFLGKKNNSYSWLITSAKMKSDSHAELVLINDTGSDDLTATLTIKNDTTYVLKQGKGSTLKVPNKGKWQKLPSEIVFIKK